MKLLNKKGFILVETLVVTLFVVTLFILVYQNLVPSIGEYETMNDYDDIDSVYALNLFKENLLRYGNVVYIDGELKKNTYLNITDCNNGNIYKNGEFCIKMKRALNILEDDYIFITNYDISAFRQTVNDLDNDFFDSGKLSNFRNYLDTVGNTDDFYDSSTTVLKGKYRLFMTRTVTNAYGEQDTKYVNIGIYDGQYKRYNIGEVVTFAPGSSTGNMTFYVLNTSTSLDSTVTLILDENIGGNVNFNSTGVVGNPDLALNVLFTNTANWNNVNKLDHSFVSTSGYTISYTGNYARLLEPSDIYTIFGNKIENTRFDSSDLFPISIDENVKFLFDNLSGDNGYWMANMTSGNNEMAWTIKNSKIIPSFIKMDNPTIGVRPIVVVSKNKLK